jgi:hypothetical protein
MDSAGSHSTTALMTATSAFPLPLHRLNAIRVNRPFVRHCRQVADRNHRVTYTPIRPHQDPQIPITWHLCPAGSCLGGFRTPAPCLTLALRADT